MPKLRPLPAAEVCKILTKHGFAKVRQAGSHIIMQKALNDGDSITVPVPNHKEIAIGTLKSIISMSKLDDSLFRK